MKLQSYDLIFYKGKSVFSKLVKWQTDSEYSHTGLLLDNVHIVDTSFRQPLKVRHFDYKLSEFDAYRVSNLNYLKIEKINNFIQRTLNDKYDYGEIFAYIVNKYLGISVNHDVDRFVCSSWVNECFKSAGIELVNGDEFVSPKGLSESERLEKVN